MCTCCYYVQVLVDRSHLNLNVCPRTCASAHTCALTCAHIYSQVALATQLERWERAEREGSSETDDESTFLANQQQLEQEQHQELVQNVCWSSFFGLQSMVWGCFGVLTLVHVYANWKGVSPIWRRIKVYRQNHLRFCPKRIHLLALFISLREKFRRLRSKASKELKRIFCSSPAHFVFFSSDIFEGRSASFARFKPSSCGALPQGLSSNIDNRSNGSVTTTTSSSSSSSNTATCSRTSRSSHARRLCNRRKFFDRVAPPPKTHSESIPHCIRPTSARIDLQRYECLSSLVNDASIKKKIHFLSHIIPSIFFVVLFSSAFCFVYDVV